MRFVTQILLPIYWSSVVMFLPFSSNPRFTTVLSLFEQFKANTSKQNRWKWSWYTFWDHEIKSSLRNSQIYLLFLLHPIRHMMIYTCIHIYNLPLVACKTPSRCCMGNINDQVKYLTIAAPDLHQYKKFLWEPEKFRHNIVVCICSRRRQQIHSLLSSLSSRCCWNTTFLCFLDDRHILYYLGQ